MPNLFIRQSFQLEVKICLMIFTSTMDIDKETHKSAI